MFIKNNSDRGWTDYDCGGSFKITIKPNSTFEVDDKIGEFLLRVLGAPAWLTKGVKEDVKGVKKERDVKMPEVKKSNSSNKTK